MGKRFDLDAIKLGSGVKLKGAFSFDQVSLALISALIATCLLCDLFVCSPPSALRDAWFDRIHPALDYISLCPRFNMFSPDPPRTNWSIEADITYADGVTGTWRFPDLNSYRSDFWMPQIKARYQYWRSYTMLYKQFPFLTPGCAIYAARLNNNPDNPPKRVKLYLLSQDILLPGDQRENKPVREQMYDYIVKPDDLR